MERPGPGRVQRGVYARRFDPQGNPIGNQFRINTTTAGAQIDPAIRISGDGLAFVTWTHNTNPGSERPELFVRAQRIDSGGAKVGDEVVANTALPFNQIIRNPDAQAFPRADGGFALTFNDQPSNLPPGWDPSLGDFITQVYNAQGVLQTEVNEVLEPGDGWEAFRHADHAVTTPDGAILIPQFERRSRSEFIPDVGQFDHYDRRLSVIRLAADGHRLGPDWVVDQVLDSPDVSVYNLNQAELFNRTPRLFVQADGSIRVGYRSVTGPDAYLFRTFSASGTPLSPGSRSRACATSAVERSTAAGTAFPEGICSCRSTVRAS